MEPLDLAATFEPNAGYDDEHERAIESLFHGRDGSAAAENTQHVQEEGVTWSSLSDESTMSHSSGGSPRSSEVEWHVESFV